ncbi:YveK family protein [Paenibacillus pinistramenti]|uniref:YveK family protein n=1 Tax=Paenibacillus pinistramenti TaxID=1768003 RepID=UPI0011081DA8|nr:Wzz/FepE/Etk N-terminal domain-containing protein [Paenibacillus pinistramenti]
MEEYTFMDYIAIIGKRKWSIVLIVLAVTLGAAVYTKFMQQPVYQASARLFINNTSTSQDKPMDINDVIFQLQLMTTYKEIIRTNAIMDKVAEEHPEFGMTGDQLIGKLAVSSAENSQVMTLQVEDPSYRRAAEIVNAVSLTFKQEIPIIAKVDNVSILTAADLSKNPAPVKPNFKRNVAFAFIAGVIGAVGLAFLREVMNNTLKSEKDVEFVLGLPTLAVIGPQGSRSRNGRARKRRLDKQGEQHNVTID